MFVCLKAAGSNSTKKNEKNTSSDSGGGEKSSAGDGATADDSSPLEPQANVKAWLAANNQESGDKQIPSQSETERVILQAMAQGIVGGTSPDNQSNDYSHIYNFMVNYLAAQNSLMAGTQQQQQQQQQQQSSSSVVDNSFVQPSNNSSGQPASNTNVNSSGNSSVSNSNNNNNNNNNSSQSSVGPDIFQMPLIPPPNLSTGDFNLDTSLFQLLACQNGNNGLGGLPFQTGFMGGNGNTLTPQLQNMVYQRWAQAAAVAMMSRQRMRRTVVRRAVFTEDQRKKLEKTFQRSKYISRSERKKLAEELHLKESQVKIWFQNRRMKDRSSSQSGSMPAEVPQNPDFRPSPSMENAAANTLANLASSSAQRAHDESTFASDTSGSADMDVESETRANIIEKLQHMIEVEIKNGGDKLSSNGEKPMDLAKPSSVPINSVNQHIK